MTLVTKGLIYLLTNMLGHSCVCCLHRMFSSLTRLNLRYSGPIMTESIASYPYKTLQRFVALFSSHPLPLTVKQIQSTASPCLKLLRTKLFCLNAATFQWLQVRWKLLEKGLTMLPSRLQSHSLVWRWQVRASSYNSNKLTNQIQQFYKFITWRFVSLNMFRAPPRPR